MSWGSKSDIRKYDVGIMMTGYDDKSGCAGLYWPFNIYINSSITHSIDEYIYHSKSIDVVITTPGALSW